jgi:hypothetical protein
MRYSNSAIRLDSIGVPRGYVRECAQPADSGSPTSHATGMDTDPQQASSARSIWSSYVPESGAPEATGPPAIPDMQIANAEAAKSFLIVFMAFPFDGVSPYRRHYIESFGVYPHVRPSSPALVFETKP